MIDAARRRGFKSDAGDGDAKDAQHANQLAASRGRDTPTIPLRISPSPTLEVSPRYGRRRDRRRLGRGRQTTMHDRNDSTSTSEKLSETRVMSPHVNPRTKRGDAKNHQTAKRKSFFVNPSTPIYILSRSEEERETKKNCPVKERMQIGVDALTRPGLSPRYRSIICVNPLFSRVDMGRHNSGDLIG